MAASKREKITVSVEVRAVLRAARDLSWADRLALYELLGDDLAAGRLKDEKSARQERIERQAAALAALDGAVAYPQAQGRIKEAGELTVELFKATPSAARNGWSTASIIRVSMRPGATPRLCCCVNPPGHRLAEARNVRVASPAVLQARAPQPCGRRPPASETRAPPRRDPLALALSGRGTWQTICAR